MARLEALDIHKSTGPDGLGNIVLKETRSVMAKYFAHLFVQSVYSGALPAEWKHATVVPIHKAGDVCKVENYRPVSLTCAACKILESILYDILMRHIMQRSPLSDTQYGFRRGRSCTTQLLGYVDDV
jgi:hypothetical protein